MNGWKSLSPDEDGYYGSGAMQEAPKEPVLYHGQEIFALRSWSVISH